MHWWSYQSFQSLFINSKPAPASVQFSFSFSSLWYCTSSCEICFAPNLSNWQLLSHNSIDSRKVKLCLKVDWQITLELQVQALPIAAMGLSNHLCYKVSLSLTGHLLPCSVVIASHVVWVSNGQLAAVHSPLHTSTLISRLGYTGMPDSPQHHTQAVGNPGTLSQTLSPPRSTMPAFLMCPHHIATWQTQRCSTRRSHRKHGINPLSSGIPIRLSGNPRDLTGL